MKSGKRDRVEQALNFVTPDRVPYTDSFQHAGLIHHYSGGRKSRIQSAKSWK
jgi:hypothetical protein